MAPMFNGFIDWYAEHLQKKVQKKSQKIRQIQLETGRTMEQVLEIQIYSMDVKQRGRIKQNVWVRRYRFLKDGNYEVLPVTSKPADARIYTDTPTVLGVAKGSTDSVTSEGAVIHRSDFTVYDAMRLGHLDYDGEATALRNLNLLQKKVLPELARELRLVPSTTS